jgi:hypothetical protein
VGSRRGGGSWQEVGAAPPQVAAAAQPQQKSGDVTCVITPRCRQGLAPQIRVQDGEVEPWGGALGPGCMRAAPAVIGRRCMARAACAALRNQRAAAPPLLRHARRTEPGAAPVAARNSCHAATVAACRRDLGAMGARAPAAGGRTRPVRCATRGEQLRRVGKAQCRHSG